MTRSPRECEALASGARVLNLDALRALTRFTFSSPDAGTWATRWSESEIAERIVSVDALTALVQSPEAAWRRDCQTLSAQFSRGDAFPDGSDEAGAVLAALRRVRAKLATAALYLQVRCALSRAHHRFA